MRRTWSWQKEEEDILRSRILEELSEDDIEAVTLGVCQKTTLGHRLAERTVSNSDDDKDDNSAAEEGSEKMTDTSSEVQSHVNIPVVKDSGLTKWLVFA